MVFFLTRTTGSFVATIEDLMPSLVIQPHQIIAARRPRQSAKQLAASREARRRRLERQVNEQLSRNLPS